ncbi:hypothetical protein Dimus_011950 [Dionaea muscipula]
MANPSLRWMAWFLSITACSLHGFLCGSVVADPRFLAMFVFGDSVIDNGNNNFLNSVAKANYMPYGIDFEQGPTGRFCNGRTFVDYIAEMLGLPYTPAFANPLEAGRDIIHGVNFASASAGILEETGQVLGDRYSLKRQVQNFQITLTQLREQMTETEMKDYLTNVLAVMILGSNDYLNNYLLPTLYPSSNLYRPEDYADILISEYNRQIVALHSQGLRKFFMASIGPLGCIPNQLASGASPPGKCVTAVNNMVLMFNTRLATLVDQLNSNHPDAKFVYGNSYDASMDILINASSYGKIWHQISSTLHEIKHTCINRLHSIIRV